MLIPILRMDDAFYLFLQKQQIVRAESRPDAISTYSLVHNLKVVQVAN